MVLYNRLFQKKLANKFSLYFGLDLTFIEESLFELSQLDKLIAISLIDIESKLLLVAYCQDDFPINEFTMESIEIFMSTQRMLTAFDTEKMQKVDDILINSSNDFSLVIPFNMLLDRQFLLYIHMEQGTANSTLIRKKVRDVVLKLKAKYV